MKTSNKLIIEGQLLEKQQQALKAMEFATQYMLKQSQYRVLNPLQDQKSDFNQVNKLASLMSELQTFSFIKQKPLNNKNSIKKSQLKNSQTKFSPSQSKIAKKYTKSISKDINKFKQQGNEEKDQQDILDIDQQQLKNQQGQPQVVFKQTLSDFSDIISQKSQTSLKKNKSKFQKVNNYKNTKKKSPQKLSNQGQLLFNFKKKKNSGTQTKNIQPATSISKPITQQQADDSQDSFENYILTKQNQEQSSSDQKQANSLHSSDFDSYHSSRVSDFKKQYIGVVSQRPSQQQISHISNDKDKPRKRNISQIKQGHKKPSDKRLIRSNINNLQNQQFTSLVIDQPKNEEPTQDQKYLIRMQYFQIQQEMLIKKINKTLNRQFKAVKQLKQIKWNDLNLPKPNFKVNVFQYAKIIE